MKPLAAGDLALEPLEARHAEEMFAVLKEPGLYRHLDYPPPASADELRQRYAKLESRKSPDGAEHWLNWVVRAPDKAALGYVQSTVIGNVAWIAYVFGSRHWGRGHATASMRAVMEHLASDCGVRLFRASVEADNARSVRLLERLGFRFEGQEGTEQLYARSLGTMPP